MPAPGRTWKTADGYRPHFFMLLYHSRILQGTQSHEISYLWHMMTLSSKPMWHARHYRSRVKEPSTLLSTGLPTDDGTVSLPIDPFLHMRHADDPVVRPGMRLRPFIQLEILWGACRTYEWIAVFPHSDLRLLRHICDKMERKRLRRISRCPDGEQTDGKQDGHGACPESPSGRSCQPAMPSGTSHSIGDAVSVMSAL